MKFCVTQEKPFLKFFFKKKSKSRGAVSESDKIVRYKKKQEFGKAGHSLKGLPNNV
jgi:hypothetical protein